MSELLPCPFCGGEMKTAVVTFDEKFYEPPYESWYLEHIDIVAAFEEHCPIPTTDTCYDTEAEAIEAWNTRYHSAFEETVIKAWEEIKAYQERTCKRFWTGAEMICSACAHQLNDATANYCPNCGAKVVGE